MLYVVCKFDNCMPINRKCATHLDQTIVLSIIQVFPDTFLPILKRHRAKFPILTGRTLGSSFSFSPFLSFYTSRSLITRRSLRSSLPLQSLITFTSITSVTSVAAWCPRSTMLAGYARNTTTTITKRWRLLVSNKKILKIIKNICYPSTDWFWLYSGLVSKKLKGRKAGMCTFSRNSYSLPWLKKMLVQRANFQLKLWIS